MKLIIPSSAARTSACAAIATRLFIGLALEAPAIHNGAWIAALLVRAALILLGAA